MQNWELLKMVIKRAALGVDYLRKKRKKKTWSFKKAFDYLLSDDYMFAPLLSSSHHFSPSTSSLGIEESSAKVKDKDFVEKVGDYLKSDCYLYSPLVITQPWLNSSSAHAAPTQTGLHGLLEKKDEEDYLLKEGTDKITTNKIAISSVKNKEQQNVESSVPHAHIKRRVIFQNCSLTSFN